MFLQKVKRVVVFVLVLITLMACSCAKPLKDEEKDEKPNTPNNPSQITPNPDTPSGGEEGQSPIEKFGSIDYIDVGGGECIYVTFPDGKDMLIDCGGAQESATEKVKQILDEKCGGSIDYFVLTHPDSEHIGNAINILNSYKVSKLYIPKILEENLPSYLTFKAVIDLAKEKDIESKYSDYYDYIVGDGYSVAFLSPKQRKGSYARFNATPSPTKEQVNDLSPIIYVDIYGVRTLLTGDAGELEEETVLDLYGVDFYDACFSKFNIDVKLEDVDFLKVADGGDQTCSTSKFLNLIRPKNAVFFVSGGSGKPSTNVLKRLQVANKNYQILRTDVSGSICVKIDEDGQYIINTEAD